MNRMLMKVMLVLMGSFVWWLTPDASVYEGYDRSIKLFIDGLLEILDASVNSLLLFH